MFWYYGLLNANDGNVCKKTFVPVEAETKVNKIYTFGRDEALSYLKWNGSTQSVIANPKSITNIEIETAFKKETMAFCLNRKGNPPPVNGASAKYSRELTKREFSPIYYSYFSGEKYGVSGKKLWYSTQVAIWCMLGQISSVRGKGLAQVDALTYNEKNGDVLKAVKAIVDDSVKNPVKPHTKGVDKICILGTPKFELNDKKTRVTITGLKTNVVVDEVFVKGSNAENVNITLDGKKIKIVADYVDGTNLKLNIGIRNLYEDYSGKVYYLDGSYQNVGFVGDSVVKTVSSSRLIKYKADGELGSIIIKKHPYVDGVKCDSTLQGAIFSVKGDSFEDGEEIFVETDEGGVARLENLPYGKYKITEIQAPTGYKLENECGEINSVDCEINKDNLVFVYDCYNALLKTSYLTIYKCDIEDRNKRLSGAKFVCKSVDGSFEAVVPEHHTAKGIYDIELPYGKYIVTEEEAPPGYVLDEENCQWEVEVGANEEDPYVNILLENSLPKGCVSIIKEDGKSGARLEGAEFSLYCKKDIVINGETKCQADELIASETSNGEGLVEFDDLFYGEYYVVEKVAPSGYLLNQNNVYDCLVDENTSNVIVTIDNEKELVTIEPTANPTIMPTAESIPMVTAKPSVGALVTFRPIPMETTTTTVTGTLLETSSPTPTATRWVEVKSARGTMTYPMEKPSSTNNSETETMGYASRPPKTGDDTILGIWIVASIVAFAVVLTMCFKMKNNK